MWLAPFSTFAIEQPDQSADDMLEESKRLFQRQKAIDAMLEGEIDAETLLDMLEGHDIDPSGYVDTVYSNLQHLCPGLALDLWL